MRAVLIGVLLATASVATAQTPDYAYAADGRRDPFVPAIGRGPVVRTAARMVRPPGIAGVLVSEIVVRGILQSQEARFAMVRAADGRTYTVHVGDRLLDGIVRAITEEAVIILQDARDPSSTASEREVHKRLRGGEPVP